jgi:hypothetical protein
MRKEEKQDKYCHKNIGTREGRARTLSQSSFDGEGAAPGDTLPSDAYLSP